MSDPNFFFESERLRFSYWLPTDEHCEFLVKLWNEPLFIAGEGNTGIDTVEKARTRIVERFIPDHERNGYGQYLVSLKDSGKKIGGASLTLLKDSAISLPDVGFAILTEETGKGYGPEAGRAVIEWVMRERGVEGVFGFCSPKNARSRRTMEKAGLEFRGIHKLLQFGPDVNGCCYATPGLKDPAEYNVGISK
ncbi:putative GNAT family acetyltransferase [Exidia glandulosa HHB12029]|uniref:Putative GNAT family acetyltransferase n=1 Tax=Exidia glandulosa HHB12029 TaxID=1314781 RepID=A0A165PYN9_EXIGL|nr:putative GNAT family acetyltransferase [Exidia glandulosa HHB12029]